MFCRYMDQFYANEDIRMTIMKKAAYADDPKCYLYDCDAERDAVVAASSGKTK